MGHLFFCSRTCFGEFRGAETLPSQSSAGAGVGGFCSLLFRNATKKLVFLVWSTKSNCLFFCVTFYLLSEGVWYTLSMEELSAESLPYNECNFLLIWRRVILSLNHQNEDWQMIPYLSTNLLCDLQQTPQLCAAVPTVSCVIVLCFGGAGCSRSCMWLVCPWSRPHHPSLPAVLCFIKKGGKEGHRKYPESTVVIVVCTGKGCSLWPICKFCSNGSWEERCCGVVLCHHWGVSLIYNHWSHMDPWSEHWEISTKCKEFCKFTERGTRSKICISTSLNKALEVNGPFLIISACVWPENTTRAETCKKPNQPTRNNAPAWAVCLCTSHSVQRTTSQYGWKQNSMDSVPWKIITAFVWKQGNYLSWVVSSLSFCRFSFFFGFRNWWTHTHYAILIPSKEPCRLNHLIFLWSERSTFLFLVEGINLNSIILNIFSFLFSALEGQWHFNLIREKHTWHCVPCKCLLTSVMLSQLSLCSSKCNPCFYSSTLSFLIPLFYQWLKI